MSITVTLHGKCYNCNSNIPHKCSSEDVTDSDTNLKHKGNIFSCQFCDFNTKHTCKFTSYTFFGDCRKCWKSITHLCPATITKSQIYNRSTKLQSHPQGFHCQFCPTVIQHYCNKN